jgi:FkbM family methyltransferase
MTAIQHHPLVCAYPPVVVPHSPADVDVDFLGVKTRRSFFADMAKGSEAPAGPVYPPFSNEYFEWIDIFEGIEEARGTFLMLDLGAGYGRWCVRAALAARRKPDLCFRCIAVEPEPEHFRWLLQHFQDNELDVREHELIWAVAGAQPGFVPFWVGRSSGWYGQAVAKRPATPLPDVRARSRLRARSILGMPPVLDATEATVIWVPTITLPDALAAYRRIDLIDMDIQGTELEVLTSAIDFVTERVRRIHIGTHSPEVEEGLRELFLSAGWQNLNDYPGQSRMMTPYGEVDFEDGVQTWLNPLLAPGASPGPARQPLGPWLKARRQLERATLRVKDLKSKNARLRERCRVLEAKLQDARTAQAPSSTQSSWRRWFRKRRDS